MIRNCCTDLVRLLRSQGCVISRMLRLETTDTVNCIASKLTIRRFIQILPIDEDMIMIPMEHVLHCVAGVLVRPL
jgi:hypothetical protein